LTRRRWLGGVSAAWFGLARADDATAVRAAPVADAVWFVQGQAALGSPANRNFISNAGFVVTDDGVVVIDALGSVALAEALIAEIRRITAQPIRHVIVTHFHADHIYGLQAFKAVGASVLAHPAGREYLNSDTAMRRLEASREQLAPWVNADTRLVGADRWLDTAQTTLRVGSFELLIPMSGRRTRPRIWWSSCRAAACCSPATWCFAAASRSSARPTAGSGSRRWTS
jgi:glyoxylase-like metal-dependent hydrolase (beta-lactamase superfamily II)